MRIASHYIPVWGYGRPSWLIVDPALFRVHARRAFMQTRERSSSLEGFCTCLRFKNPA